MARSWVVAIALLTTMVAGCGIVDVLLVPHARTCAEWSHLGAEARLQTAAALIEPTLMANVRERQHLSADTPDKDVLVAVAGSLDKICEIERRPGRLLTDIVTGLYR